MLKLKLRQLKSASLLLVLVLLASTTCFSTRGRAQELRRTPEPPQSIVSLAPAARPQGELVARHPGDATFERALPNYHVFAAATAGEDAGVEVLTLNFAAATRLTDITSTKKDFVLEAGGTCREGSSYPRGGACTLLVRFSPQGPGHRLGFLNVSHSAEAKPMSFGLVGNGSSPVVSFTPALITTVPGTYVSGAGTIKSATSLAIDGGDILYVADVGNDLIKEMDSTGTLKLVQPAFATPATLTVDNFGIIYSVNVPASTYYFSDYYPWETQSAWGTTYAGGTCTPSTPCALPTVGLSGPANISIDAYDDVFMEERTKGAVEMPVAGLSGGNGTLDLWYLTDEYNYDTTTPASFSVDANGNLYNSFVNTYGGVCWLMEESEYAAEYSPSATRVAGGTNCGFSGDGGQARSAEISTSIGQMAFDVAGNLYFADTANQRVRRIDASTGIIQTIAGNGTAGYSGDTNSALAAELNNPTGVAVDSSGEVYIISSAATNQVIRKLGTTSIMWFATHVLNTSSTTQHVTVSNTGNAALVFSSYRFTGANPADFSVDLTSSTCILTPGATLAVGRSCTIGIYFKPTGTGNRAASLVLNDNTVTNANTITMAGVGNAINLSATGLSFGSEPVGVSTANQSVTLQNAGATSVAISSVALTGANTTSFGMSNGCSSTLAAGATCAIQVHFLPTTAGPLTAAVTITDNGGASPQTVTLSGTGTASAVTKASAIFESAARNRTAAADSNQR